MYSESITKGQSELFTERALLIRWQKNEEKYQQQQLSFNILEKSIFFACSCVTVHKFRLITTTDVQFTIVGVLIYGFDQYATNCVCNASM